MKRTTLRLAAVIATLGSLAALSARAKRAPLGTPREAPFDLEEASIADLQQRLSSGRDSARTLSERYIARIEKLDRRGPSLRAVIEMNPDALAIADRLDAERKVGRLRGPLHGVPILIKDNIATADRMMTTAGSLALINAHPPHDAFIVKRLREAGVVILGKTNLAEWANFRSPQSSNGWSARGGQTRNPYALDRSPIGSSSGSAAAVAASLCAVAVGTETDGSVIAPSSAQALVGIKPTLGLIGRSGIVPIAHSQDTAGPMARTVADAAILLGAMTGEDSDDPATAGSGKKGHQSYTAFLDAGGLKGARIGIVRARMSGVNAATDRLAEAAVEDMRQQGAVIVDPADIPTLGQFDASEFEVLLYEFKADLEKYLAWIGPASPIHSLRELIAFNDAHQAEEMPFFGQEILVQSERKGPLTSADYKKALAKNHRLSRTLGIDLVMDTFKLDALVAPSMIPPNLIDLINGDSVPFAALSASSPMSIAAVAGYPHITVPMGFVDGLPVGISFFGRAWSEPTLLKIAYAYEQATRHRRPPTFAASAHTR
jgi:amidase